MAYRHRPARNWGARVHEITWAGLDALVLENELLRVTVLAGKGATTSCSARPSCVPGMETSLHVPGATSALLSGGLERGPAELPVRDGTMTVRLPACGVAAVTVRR